MIVGGYSLDLYCVHEKLPVAYQSRAESCPPGHHWWDEFPHEYYGNTERECKRQARKSGWKFINGDAVCPRCRRAPPSKGNDHGE